MCALMHRRPAGCRGAALALWLAIASAGGLHAQAAPPDVETQLDTVLVTAPGEDGRLRTVPHSVTVFDRARIERSAAVDLGALLGEAANVQFRSFFGGDKRAAVDIRGMGDTAGSNVLILLNGQRLNEIDLSGTDLASVPVDQIERIEIVRGGGAVRHGDGAVGGVVNIITRQAGGASGGGGTVALAAGSYDRREGRASVFGRAGSLSARAETRDLSTEGYRDNNAYSAHDRAVELRLTPEALDILDLSLRAAVHRDTYGMPGPVLSREAFRSGERARRAASDPSGRGRTDDRTVRLRAYLDLGAAGQGELSWFGRHRENPYVLQSTDGRIDSRQRELNAHYGIDLGRHALTVGAQRLWGDYERFDGAEAVVGTKRKQGRIVRRAWFVEDRIRLPGAWSLVLGYRKARTESALRNRMYDETCDYVFVGPIPVPVNCRLGYGPDPDPASGDRSNTWRSQAREVGLSWRASERVTLFASHSHQFRSPNLDELVLADADLRPQRGITDEVGIRLSPRADLTVSATVFSLRNTDEIYYGRDPASGQDVNRNYERPTRRTGLELETRWQPTPAWQVDLAAGYVRPRFEGIDADIPQVARKSATLRVGWTPDDAWRTSVTVHHVGARFDGNDLDNRTYARLPAYNLTDLAVRYVHRDLTVTATVFNLFDKVYSTQAYSETYYPMPGRHLLVAASWAF